MSERFLGARRIGTTGRGIGPTYADKVNRVGIRVQDLFDESILRQKVQGALDQKNQLLVKVYNRREVDVDAVVEELLPYADKLRPFVADTSLLLNRALDEGRHVLLEGVAGHAARRRPRHVPVRDLVQPDRGRRVRRGWDRADAHRPGDRHPQGVHDARRGRAVPDRAARRDGARLREIGGERGVTTGRDRRCGWFDALVARYATRVNGLTDIFLTKLDVLTGFETIPVCVAYDVDGVRHDEMPPTQTEFHHAKPIYEYFDGWDDDIRAVRAFDDLPDAAQRVRPGARRAERRPGVGDRRGPGTRRDRRPPPPPLAPRPTCGQMIT